MGVREALAALGARAGDAKHHVDALMSQLGKAQEVSVSGPLLGTVKMRDDLDTPEHAQKISDAFVRQLTHLADIGEIQRQHLQAGEGRNTLMLEVAIFGLTGIREQLEQALRDFDTVVQTDMIIRARRTAKLQADDGQQGAIVVDTSTLHPIHETHPVTAVAPEPLVEPSRATGWLSFLKRQRPPSHNERMAADLSAVYSKFDAECRRLIETFHTAQAKNLEELNTPVDEVRATAIWLNDTEQQFYRIGEKMATRSAGA